MSLKHPNANCKIRGNVSLNLWLRFAIKTFTSSSMPSSERKAWTIARQKGFLRRNLRTTLEEQVSFTARFKDLAVDQLPNIVGLLSKITSFSKVQDIQDLVSVRGAISVCQTLNQTLSHLVALQTTYLESVAKMAYLT